MTDIKLPSMPNFREWPYSHEELRARDIEVSKCVLEAAAVATTNAELPADDRYIAGVIAGVLRTLKVSHD